MPRIPPKGGGLRFLSSLPCRAAAFFAETHRRNARVAACAGRKPRKSPDMRTMNPALRAFVFHLPPPGCPCNFCA